VIKYKAAPPRHLAAKSTTRFFAYQIKEGQCIPISNK